MSCRSLCLYFHFNYTHSFKPRKSWFNFLFPFDAVDSSCPSDAMSTTSAASDCWLVRCWLAISILSNNHRAHSSKMGGGGGSVCLLWSYTEAKPEQNHITHTPGGFSFTCVSLHLLTCPEVSEPHWSLNKRLSGTAHVRLLTCRVCCCYLCFQRGNEAPAACDECLMYHTVKMTPDREEALFYSVSQQFKQQQLYLSNWYDIILTVLPSKTG